MDYKILEPRETPLPDWRVPWSDIKDNIFAKTLNVILKNVDEQKSRLVREVVEIVLKLRSKYSRMQETSITGIFHETINATGKIYTISAPTGWGKTEAFLIPGLLYSLISKILTDGEKSIRVLIIYPRKSLASNQVKRLIKDYIQIIEQLEKSIYRKELEEYLPIVAIRDGQSMDPSNYRPGQPFRVHNVKISSGKGREEKCSVRIASYSMIAVECRDKKYILPFTNTYVEKREDIGFIPDILILNLDMLNRSLSAPRFRELWSNSKYLGYIVFDEAHIYYGTNFLHMINILKRLRSFLERIHGTGEEVAKKPVIVFASATLQPNYLDEIKKALNTKHIDEINHKGSEHPVKKKLEIPVIIAPRPNVAGQWIAQLIAIYNVLYTIHKGLKTYKKLDKPVPYKTIMFIDSLRYLFGLRSYVNHLLKRIDKIVDEHAPKSENTPYDRDTWKFIDRELIEVVKNKRSIVLNSSIRIHYGDLDQGEREKIEEEFQTKLLPALLLSTSTLELGIDIPDIWQISQFRPPLSSDSFIQRIGRAGRSLKTNYIALGTLILTNMPSDISYLVDSERQKALFNRTKLKVPLNKTIENQHMILAILDYLNTNIILGKIPESKSPVLNSFYYRVEELSHAEKIKDLLELIMKYKTEIKEYLMKTFNKNEDYAKQVISEFIRDLSVSAGILSEESINKFIGKIDEIYNTLINLHTNGLLSEIKNKLIKVSNHIEASEWKRLYKLISEIDNLMGSLIYYIKKLLAENSLRSEMIIEISKSLENLKEINENLQRSIESLDKYSEGEVNRLIDSLLELYNIIREIIEHYMEIEEICDYAEFAGRREQYESISENLLQYLSFTLSKSIYSSILSTPLKSIEIIYQGPKTHSRSENFFQAFKRLANLNVDKRPVGG